MNLKNKWLIPHAGYIKVNHHMWFMSRLAKVGTAQKIHVYKKLDKSDNNSNI